jgi:hypothetical protein
MSTDFTIVGAPALTQANWEQLARAEGWSFPPHDDNTTSSKVLKTKTGYVWVYQTSRHQWKTFTRFGGNYASADEVVEALERHGYVVKSEYD